MLFTIASFLAPILSVTLFLPQAKVAWSARNNPEQLQGISALTQALALTNTLCWGLMAIHLGTPQLGIPTLVNGPVTAFVLILKYRAYRTQQKSNAHHKATA